MLHGVCGCWTILYFQSVFDSIHSEQVVNNLKLVSKYGNVVDGCLNRQIGMLLCWPHLSVSSRFPWIHTSNTTLLLLSMYMKYIRQLCHQVNRFCVLITFTFIPLTVFCFSVQVSKNCKCEAHVWPCKCKMHRFMWRPLIYSVLDVGDLYVQKHRWKHNNSNVNQSNGFRKIAFLIHWKKFPLKEALHLITSSSHQFQNAVRFCPCVS